MFNMEQGAPTGAGDAADELAASIAHEINQCMAAIIANGHACLRWLDQDTPDLAEVRDAITRMIRAGRSASEIIHKIRVLQLRGGAHAEPVSPERGK